MNNTINKPFNIGFLLIEEFALMSFSAVVEPLRAANLIGKSSLYEIDYYCLGDNDVTSSNGATVRATQKFSETKHLDLLLVVAGYDATTFQNDKVFKFLQSLHRQSIPLGGVSGGPAILQFAGVMKNRRMTVHWEFRSALIEIVPDALVERSIYVIDRDRLTCAGGIAALDMMNALITEHHGYSFAQKVSDWFLHTEIRPSAGPQRAGLSERYPTATQNMLLAIEAMNNHIADPLDLQQLSRICDVTARQMNRLFSEKLNTSTMDFYKNMRLERAKKMLEQSSIKIIDIAQATGYVSAAHFSSAFNKKFGISPSALRKEVVSSYTS